MVFDSIVALENLAAIVAAVEVKWLSTRYHWMTGPKQLDTIGHAQIVAFLCSFLALILGVCSLPAFRGLQRHGCENLGTRKIWLYTSFGVSAILAFLSLLPTRVG